MTRICSNVNCNKSGEPQFLEKFYKNPGAPEGRCSQCKACTSKRRAEKYKEDKLARVADPMPCAGHILLKQSLENEMGKLAKSSIERFSDDVVCIDKVLADVVDDYKKSCMKTVSRLKALLQEPV